MQRQKKNFKKCSQKKKLNPWPIFFLTQQNNVIILQEYEKGWKFANKYITRTIFQNGGSYKGRKAKKGSGSDTMSDQEVTPQIER